MKARQLLGQDTLDKAIRLVNKRIPIATVVRILALDDVIHYRTAFNLIKADMQGLSAVTRPSWLTAEPTVQTAPDHWALVGGMTDKGKWIYYGEAQR